MDCKKIVLINPPDRFLTFAGDRIPLALPVLSSYVKQFGHEVRGIDLNHDKESDLIRLVKEWKPDFAGFSVATPNYNNSISIVSKVRQASPETQIIGGGHHVTNYKNDEALLKDFDFIVRGEGELSLKNILEDEFGFNRVYPNTPFPNLDDLPLPDYELLDYSIDKYTMKLEDKPAIVLCTSRGCPLGCAFCNNASIKTKWRYHSSGYVVDHMWKVWNDYGVRAFYFGDDVFSLHKPRAIDLFQKIADENFPDMTIRLTTRVDMVNEELLKTMKMGGCDIISFGIESGVQSVLDAIDKRTTVQAVEEAVALCKKVDIKVKGFFIFGLPSSTWETEIETIKWAKKLDIDYYDFYPLTVYPGTPLWNNPDMYGIKVNPLENEDWSNYFQLGKNGTPDIMQYKHPNFSDKNIKDIIWLAKEVCKKSGSTYETR